LNISSLHKKEQIKLGEYKYSPYYQKFKKNRELLINNAPSEQKSFIFGQKSQ